MTGKNYQQAYTAQKVGNCQQISKSTTEQLKSKYVYQ